MDWTRKVNPVNTSKRRSIVQARNADRFRNLLCCWLAWIMVGCAQTSFAFIDNFDRANTPAQSPTNSPDLIGPQWTVGNGSWAIQNNQLVQDGGPNVGSQFILLNPLPTLNSGGTNFVEQATMQMNTTAGSAYGGLLFNYQNSSNYYALRYSGSGNVQLYFLVNGSEGATSWNPVFPVATNRPYRLSVTSPNAGTFSASVYDPVGGTNVWAVTNQSMSNGNFTNGLGGLYTDGNFGMVYDDFSLTVTPALPALVPVVTSNILWGALSGIPSTLGIIGGKYAPTDANGYALTVAAVTPGANGAVSTDGTSVTYTSGSGFSGTDHFNYTVSDGQGGAATGMVTVVVVTNGPGFNRLGNPLFLGAGNIQVNYQGLPGHDYVLDWTGDLSPPVIWSPQTNLTLDASGQFILTNGLPWNPGFWRMRPAGGSNDNRTLLPQFQPDAPVTMEGLDPDWVKTLIIAECRIETATAAGTFAAATNILEHYAQMGVNGLWIDPIWERGSTDNGYVNYGPNVVEPLLTGTADTNLAAVAAFVQAAHQKNIRVFFDIIVWGTTTNSPLVTQHPEFYTTNADGSFWQVWGGYGFDWSRPQLQTWYANAAENFILQNGDDGFRVDLAPCTSGYFFQTIRTNLLAQGRKIFIMGECPNDRLGTFDTEQRSFGNFGSDDYLLTNNIVDVIRSGTGIGTVAGAGQYRYYTANFCNHDDRAPVCGGNRVRFAYGSLFAPFIPMWWIGEEWNNPLKWLPVPMIGALYFNTIDWAQLSLPPNRAFFEDVKRYIWINRTFPEIFENYATNHVAANIAKVDTRINGLTNNLQAYARLAAGEAVLVVPNYGTTNGTTVQIIPDYNALGLGASPTCRIIDLMTGNEIAAGPVAQLASFTTEIQANYLGVYWLKGSP